MEKTKQSRRNRQMRGVRYDKTKGKWVATWFEDGLKKRKFFATETEAKHELRDHREQLKEHGEASFDYDAVAHQEFQAAKKHLPQGAKLADAVDFFVRHRVAAMDSPSIGDAVDEFMTETVAGDFSIRHVDTLRIRLDKLKERFAGSTVSEITGGMVAEWLRGGVNSPYVRVVKLTGEDARNRKRADKRRQYARRVGKAVEHVVSVPKTELVAMPKAKTVMNWRGYMLNFFNWAKAKGYTPDFAYPVNRADVRKIVFERQVFAVKELGAVFTDLASRPETSKFIPYYALQAFAGIRNAEVQRMTWGMVDLAKKRIVLSADITKTDDGWVMPGLSVNLFTMLAKYKPTGAKRDDLILSPAQVVIGRLHRRWIAAGIIEGWAKNGLRHSFATYHLSLGQPNPDPGKTAFLLRHSSQTQLFKNYFKKLADKDEAEAYFDITV